MGIGQPLPPGGRPPGEFISKPEAPPPPPPPPPIPEEAVQAAFSLSHLLEGATKALNRNLGNMLKIAQGPTPGIEERGAEAAASSFVSEYAEQKQAKDIRWEMYEQQLGRFGAACEHCIETLPVAKREILEEDKNRFVRELLDRQTPPEVADEYAKKLNSPSNFFDKLIDLIGLIKSGYLDVYQHIIEAYSQFFADFNSQITAMMKDWIEGANEGKEVKLNVGALRAALNKLLSEYSPPNPKSVLFPAPGQDGASREEADNWRKSLGLPEKCLVKNPDGTYSVVMDNSPLSTMLGSLPSGNSVTWDTARFQAWQTGFNAQEERMKNMLQSYMQKYSNANSYHDNFNKTLSSHLNQFADMLRAMLNF
jgi:invasin D